MWEELRGGGRRWHGSSSEPIGGVHNARLTRLTALAAIALVTLLGLVLAQSASAKTGSATRLRYSLTPSSTMPYTPCPPGGRMIECNIVIDPPAVQTPSGYEIPGVGSVVEGGGLQGGYDPADIQLGILDPGLGGSGQTVALIDAYSYASAESDLAKYREFVWP